MSCQLLNVSCTCFCPYAPRYKSALPSGKQSKAGEAKVNRDLHIFPQGSRFKIGGVTL